MRTEEEKFVLKGRIAIVISFALGMALSVAIGDGKNAPIYGFAAIALTMIAYVTKRKIMRMKCSA